MPRKGYVFVPDMLVAKLRRQHRHARPCSTLHADGLILLAYVMKRVFVTFIRFMRNHLE